MKRHQLGIAVARPQGAVVGGFLDVHVLEVLGHEQRQVPVQAHRAGCAISCCCGTQLRRLTAQGLDGICMFQVVVGRAGRAAGAAGVDGRVHVAVFVRDVAGAQAQQRFELVHHPAHVSRVLDIQLADPQQRVHHEMAQGLVDGCVQVYARHGRRSGGDRTRLGHRAGGLVSGAGGGQGG